MEILIAILLLLGVLIFPFIFCLIVPHIKSIQNEIVRQVTLVALWVLFLPFMLMAFLLTGLEKGGQSAYNRFRNYEKEWIALYFLLIFLYATIYYYLFSFCFGR